MYVRTEPVHPSYLKSQGNIFPLLSLKFSVWKGKVCSKMDDHEADEEETTTKRLPRGVRVDEQVSLTGDDGDLTPTPKANLKGDEYDSIPDLADLELATQYHVVDRTFRRRQLLKRLAVVSGAILAVVGFSVGIALSVSSSKSSSAASASSSSSSIIVPPPPQDLSTLCDANNLMTDSGRAQCKAACAPAACCASKLESCQAANIETCEAYSYACLLQQPDTTSQSQVSDAEKLIMTLCEDTTDLESMKQCKKLCAARDCCFNIMDVSSGYNCYDDFKEWCDEYKVCATLKNIPESSIPLLEQQVPISRTTQPPTVTPITITEAPVSVEKALVQKVCSMDAISANGSKDCADLCRERACCFVDETEFNCIQERSDWCLEYSLCTILNMREGGGETMNTTVATTAMTTSVTTPTANEVDKKCSFDFLIAYGSLQCESLCDAGQCCFATDDSSCAANLQEWCLMFTACKNLMASSASNPSSSPVASTSTETSEVVNTTEATTLAIDNSIGIPNSVATVCSLDFIAANGKVQCESFCDRGKCCFTEDETNCAISLEQFCLEFHDCANLQEAPSSLNIVAENVTVPEMTENAANMTVEGTENTIADIITLAPTQVPVNNSSTLAPIMDSVNSSCTAEVIAADGKDKCKVICKERACCFIQGDFNCYAERQIWCEEYSACNILSTYTTSIPAAINQTPTQSPFSIYADLSANSGTAVTNAPSLLIPTVVPNSTEAPVATEPIYSEIAATLAPSPLQMSSNSNYSSPFVTSTPPVQQPVASVSIYGDMPGTNAPVMISSSINVTLNVNDVCTPEAIAANGDGECMTKCLERECCFIAGESSCTETLKDWCEEYNACYILSSFQT